THELQDLLADAVHVDRERNAAEADECNAEFFFAQEQPPEPGGAVPPLLERSLTWIGLEIEVMRNAPGAILRRCDSTPFLKLQTWSEPGSSGLVPSGLLPRATMSTVLSPGVTRGLTVGAMLPQSKPLRADECQRY